MNTKKNLYKNKYMWTFLIQYIITCGFYLTFASIVNLYENKVNRNTTSDKIQSLLSLFYGSCMMEVIKFTHMFDNLYHDIFLYGWIYWICSILIYVFIWDFVFYLTHVLLHTKILYSYSHHTHHKCRPTSTWSAVAIDFIDTIFTGIIPYVTPILFIPMHEYTVYFINMILMVWSMIVHSNMKIIWKNKYLITPTDHNLHHYYGMYNYNYGGFTKIWDILFGTYCYLI